MNFAFPPPPPSAHLRGEAGRDRPALRRSHRLPRGLDFEITRGRETRRGRTKRRRQVHLLPPHHRRGGPQRRPPRAWFKTASSHPSSPRPTPTSSTRPRHRPRHRRGGRQPREHAPQARNLLGCFLFRGDDVFKQVNPRPLRRRALPGCPRPHARAAPPTSSSWTSPPTTSTSSPRQVLQTRPARNYEGTVIIVSHNRAFLDPLVDKTLEFRPGAKTPSSTSTATSATTSTRRTEEERRRPSCQRATPAGIPRTRDRKRHFRTTPPPPPPRNAASAEAELRQKRAQVLKPLQEELNALEEKIAELEAAQGALTTHLNDPAVASDPEKLREATEAYQSLARQLEKSITRWTDLSAELEKAEARLAPQE